MELTEYGVALEREELRAIIKGEIGFRKCPDCEGHGESWTLHYVLADDPKEIEETMMYRDMQVDIVQQILRRLIAVKSL